MGDFSYTLEQDITTTTEIKIGTLNLPTSFDWTSAKGYVCQSDRIQISTLSVGGYMARYFKIPIAQDGASTVYLVIYASDSGEFLKNDVTIELHITASYDIHAGTYGCTNLILFGNFAN